MITWLKVSSFQDHLKKCETVSSGIYKTAHCILWVDLQVYPEELRLGCFSEQPSVAAEFWKFESKNENQKQPVSFLYYNDHKYYFL